MAENLILLRFIEMRSRLYRLISALKVRDSDFDPSLYQFNTTDQGLAIKATPESAEAIMAGCAHWPAGVTVPGEGEGEAPPTRHG